MSVYISGKNGFIGSYLQNALCNEYNVIKEEFNLDNIDMLYDYYPSVIIHCAAKVGSQNCYNNYRDAYISNIIGTYNIAKIAKELNAYFVYCSSIDVYKFKSELNILNEGNELMPKTLYGRTKLEGEKICEELLSKYLILRLGYIFGEKSVDKYSLISKIQRNENISYVGDYKKDYLYIDDCVDAIMKLLNIQYEGIVNVGSGEMYSIKSILEIFEKDILFSSHDYTKNFVVPSNILRVATKWVPRTNFWNKIIEFRKEK